MKVLLDKARKNVGIPTVERNRDISERSGLFHCIEIAQRECFQNEIYLLYPCPEFPLKKKIFEISPFLDHGGILRVGED